MSVRRRYHHGAGWDCAPPNQQVVQLLTKPATSMKTNAATGEAIQTRPMPLPGILPWGDQVIEDQLVAGYEHWFPDRRSLPLSIYLEQIAVLFMQACNVRSRAFMEAVVVRFVAPSIFVNKAEGFGSLSRDAYIQGKMDFWATNPFFRLQPRLITAVVDETTGTALVFSTNSIVGTVQRRPELTREEVTVCHFQRRQSGEWVIVKFETLRGPGHWTYEVGHPD